MEPEKLREFLMRGAVLVVQLTPFKENEEVDFEGLRENTRFLVEKRHLGQLVLVPNGSTGEFYALSEEEQKKLIKTVVDEANGKVPVIAGTAHSGTKPTIEMSKYAEDVGADGVMVVLPYYHVPNEEGMYLHYKAVSEAINIGILVYNNPDTSKCYIKPSLMARIADLPGVVGVKENTPYIPTYYAMQRVVGHKIPVLCGRGEFFFAVEALLGCPGYISGIANFYPEISLEILKAARSNDFVKVRELIKKLEPLDDFIVKVDKSHDKSTTILPYPYIDSYMFLSVYKACMDAVGLKGGRMRLPIPSLTEEEKKELESVLEKLMGEAKP